MSDEPEKLSELLALRLTPTMAAQLDEAVRITGIHRAEIARAALMGQLDRILRTSGDRKLGILITRCRELAIDVEAVLQTAVIEEELSPTPAEATA